MFKKYYIEVRDSSDELKEFYLYDNYGEWIRALRSIPKTGGSGFWRPNASLGYPSYSRVSQTTFHNDYKYAGDHFGKYVPNEAQQFLGLTAKLSSLLTLTDYEIAELSNSVPHPVIDAAKEFEIQRIKKGYFRGLLDTYWSRYRDLYLALLVFLVTASVPMVLVDCNYWGAELYDYPPSYRLSHVGSRFLIIAFWASITTYLTTIGFLVYRHFAEWTPVFWLTFLSVLLMGIVAPGGVELYCG